MTVHNILMAAAGGTNVANYWFSLYNNLVATSFADFNAVGFDSNENVVVAGRNNTSTYLISKQRPDAGYYSQFSYSANPIVQALVLDSSDAVCVVSNTSTLASAVVHKYNSSGVWSWGKSLSAYSDVDTDSSNNVYLMSPQAASSTAGVFKLNSSGTIQWQRSINETGYKVAVDSSGNVYATTNGVNVSHIVKFNSSGTVQWQRKLTVSPAAYIRCSVVVDSSGNVFVAGQYTNTSTTYTEGFVAKYNSSGAIQWQRKIVSGGQNFTMSGCDLDSSGNLYVTGYYGASGAVGVAGWLAKYDTSGAIQWQRRIYGTYSTVSSLNTSIYSISLSSSGSIGVSGTLSYGGTAGSPTGSLIAIIAKLPSTGLGTGTYGTINYATATLTDSAGSLTDAAGTATVATSSYTLTAQTAPTTSTVVDTKDIA